MNPYFTMNPNDDDEERQPDSFDVDDESDVYFLQQAYEYHERLLEEENHPRLTRNPIHRDREGAEDRLMGDYFDEYSTIRQLAYGNTPDVFDEYLQMSERTARDCLLHFNKCIIDLYMSKYLRKPTLKDVEKIYNQHVTRHGFPGMLESIDCMHQEWKNYPVSWQG
ncbi:ALP1-like protein [Tanacetum coccineum]